MTFRDNFAEFLSTSPEIHAFGIGIYHGFRTRNIRAPDELPDNDDVQAEPHYYKIGFIVGTFVQLAFLVVAAYFGIDFVGLDPATVQV